jgi:hypothetical protein
MDQYIIVGLPGCASSVDCVHVFWDACPPAPLQIRCKGKEKYPTLVFEVVVSHIKKILSISCAVWNRQQQNKFEIWCPHKTMLSQRWWHFKGIFLQALVLGKWIWSRRERVLLHSGGWWLQHLDQADCSFQTLWAGKLYCISGVNGWKNLYGKMWSVYWGYSRNDSKWCSYYSLLQSCQWHALRSTFLWFRMVVQPKCQGLCRVGHYFQPRFGGGQYYKKGDWKDKSLDTGEARPILQVHAQI